MKVVNTTNYICHCFVSLKVSIAIILCGLSMVLGSPAGIGLGGVLGGIGNGGGLNGGIVGGQ